MHTNTEHILKWGQKCGRDVGEKSWRLPALGYSLSGSYICKVQTVTLFCSVNLKKSKIKILWPCTESAVCGWDIPVLNVADN